MKVQELVNKMKNDNAQYADIEVYYSRDNKRSYHTDSIHYNGEPIEDAEVLDYTLMDEEDYDNTILANSGEHADFEGWYGDKNAKVLVILVRE